MIQLSILNGRKAGTRIVNDSFPFSIGRASACSLVLDEAGVWDRHLDIQCVDDEFTVAVGPDAVVSLNGDPLQTGRVRDGDVIELGSVKVRFGFSPMRQSGLYFREALTWLALTAVCLGQVAIIYMLAE